jgi:iron-sulfur cluster repair protein YtfE (RIC family)
MATRPSIHADMTVNDVLLAQPDAAGPLHDFGIDSCCGGGRTLREVAQLHDLDLGALLQAVGADAPDAGGAGAR